MARILRTLIVILLTVTAESLFAQANYKIQGTVTNSSGTPIQHISVKLGTTSETSTDGQGRFIFTNLAPQNYILTIASVAYHTYTDTLTLSPSQVELDLQIRLIYQNNAIDEVSVVGKTATQQVREQAIRAIVVDTKEAADQPATLSELMNRSPGVRIRQSGGLGNQVDVSINGFQGNSVQYFRDGIPLEYLSGGYGINNVPINQLDRVEVYKGVVPVGLGGDALGGAVNLISRKSVGTDLNASYEIASFNTHIANLSLHHRSSNGLIAGVDAFYNYADNNYKADVEVVNEYANLDTVTVPLFHNGYQHYFAEAYVGLEDKTWADEFKISIAKFGVERESQHPALMTNPYGAVMVGNSGIVPSLRYRKTLLDERINIDQFASYSWTNRTRVDTIRGTFDWYGNFTPNGSGNPGESPNASLSDIDFSTFISRTNIGYVLNDRHNFQANIVLNHSSRVGSDPLGLRFAGTDIDVLSNEAIYKKNIAGLQWESKWLNNKLTNQLFAKYFNFQSSGINAFLSNDTDLDKFANTSNNSWGFGDAIKYQIDAHSIIRASVELTNRLPRVEELFGDNDTRAPNFNLRPERSLNINLGYRIEKPTFSFEANTFYRKTQGMILLIPIQSPFSQYQNLDSIRGYGLDLDASYRIHKHIELMGNVTWQDNRMTDIGTEMYKWTEGTRLRNTPYFFANLGLNGRFEHILRRNDLLKPYVYYNYVREFYLIPIPRDKEPQGFLGIFGQSGVAIRDLVPDQHLVTAGFNYTLPSSLLSFGFEVKNLTNEKLYDYYKVQRPGRSFHFKINYQLKSIKI